MSFDLERILASKRALRRNLATRPLAEKQRMLDAMRERALAIRASAPRSTSTIRLEKRRRRIPQIRNATVSTGPAGMPGK
jgi:hypothetical protein